MVSKSELESENNKLIAEKKTLESTISKYQGLFGILAGNYKDFLGEDLPSKSSELESSFSTAMKYAARGKPIYQVENSVGIEVTRYLNNIQEQSEQVATEVESANFNVAANNLELAYGALDASRDILPPAVTLDLDERIGYAISKTKLIATDAVSGLDINDESFIAKYQKIKGLMDYIGKKDTDISDFTVASENKLAEYKTMWGGNYSTSTANERVSLMILDTLDELNDNQFNVANTVLKKMENTLEATEKQAGTYLPQARDELTSLRNTYGGKFDIYVKRTTPTVEQNIELSNESEQNLKLLE